MERFEWKLLPCLFARQRKVLVVELSKPFHEKSLEVEVSIRSEYLHDFLSFLIVFLFVLRIFSQSFVYFLLEFLVLLLRGGL